MDPLAVYLTMQKAVEHMRSGNGPTLVEADVYRYFHQNGPFPGSAFGYRDKAEEAAWRDRDPIKQTQSHVVRRGIMTDDEIADLRSRCTSLMSDVASRLVEDNPDAPGTRRFIPSLWPDPTTINDGIRSDLAEIVNEVAGVDTDDVQLDKSFVDDLDVDSLSMVEVVVAAEEKFGVSIPDDEVKNLKTVGDAVAYIERASAAA